MRRIYSFVLLSSALGPWSAPAASQQATAQSTASASPVANQYICMFDASVGKGDVRSEANRATGPELGRVLHLYQNTIRGFAVRLPASAPGSANAIARLRENNPRISQCVADGITRAALQRRPTAGPTTPWGVARVGGAGDGSGLANRAWVIDSGIDLNHPDLNVDIVDDYDVIDGDSVAEDGHGHGTHVAGIIGALNNTIGVVGVAAGVKVVPIRVLNDQGVGPDSGVIAGIDRAAGIAVPGDVINLSLVADAVDPLMDEAVRRAAALGILVTIAAGNASTNAANYSPGRTEGAGIYTVSAFGSQDTFARFSNYGNPPVDYSEPGVDIRSTFKGDTYAVMSGTSMAAPHLAGILLLNPAGPSAGGTVKRDPDGNADTIGVR